VGPSKALIAFGAIYNLTLITDQTATLITFLTVVIGVLPPVPDRDAGEAPAQLLAGPIGWRICAGLTAVSGAFFLAELIATVVWKRSLAP